MHFESRIKMKIKLNFYFRTLCSVPKGFMKALKAFIKPFETPQRSVKIKTQLNFFSSSGVKGQQKLFKKKVSYKKKCVVI